MNFPYRSDWSYSFSSVHILTSCTVQYLTFMQDVQRVSCSRQLASLSQLTSFRAFIHTPHTPLQVSFIVKVSIPAPRLNNIPLEATIRKDLTCYSLSKSNFTYSSEDSTIQIVRICALSDCRHNHPSPHETVLATWIAS